MKRYLLIMSIMVSFSAIAQQVTPKIPDSKKQDDSLTGDAKRKSPPFILPKPNTSADPRAMFGGISITFEELNPGATIINKSARGTVYNMPVDNMAALKPDMKLLEKMPGSSSSILAPPKNGMPNPLYPRVNPNRKKKE